MLTIRHNITSFVDVFFNYETTRKIIKYLEDNKYIFPITEEYLMSCTHSYLVDYVKLLPSTSSEGSNIPKKIKEKKISKDSEHPPQQSVQIHYQNNFPQNILIKHSILPPSL